jgi:hypothetical protein
VKRRQGSFSVRVAAPALAVLLFMACTLSAQVKQEVPSNPLAPAGPVQPVPYNHKVHLALGLQCTGCHSNPDPAVLMTFPATSTCMKCHATVGKNKPSIQKLAGYDKSKSAVPWVRVYTLRPGYQWSHRQHLAAGIGCETCHGQVAQMEVMSEVTSVVTMYSCLNCHKLHDAKTACVTCHPFGSAGPYG